MDCHDVIPLVNPGDIVCEIGCRTGISTEGFLKKGARVYTVDPWMKYDGYNEHVSEDQYKAAVARLSSWGDQVTILRMMSSDAVPSIPMCDLVWIDGNHEYEYVCEDIRLYWEKVKDGGYLSGDDYRTHSGVTRAVNHCIQENELELELGNRSWIIKKTKDSPKTLTFKGVEPPLVKTLEVVMSFEYLVRQKKTLGKWEILGMFIERHSEDDRICIARCFVPNEDDPDQTNEIFLMVSDDGTEELLVKQITNLTMESLQEI